MIITTRTASDFATMTAADVLETLCPGGEAIDGIEVDQDWNGEATRLTFSDGSTLVVSGTFVEVSVYPTEESDDQAAERKLGGDDVQEAEAAPHGITFSAWLTAAGRSDSASEYDLRAAWRAGESPEEYR